MKRKISKIAIFNVLSIIFLLSLCVIYGYRLVHYYKLEHIKYDPVETKLVDVLLSNKGIEGVDSGLQKDGDNYMYAAKSIDNYLSYKGRMWRIVSIDDSNITLITDEVQTILGSTKEYENSDVSKWNTGIFKKSLKDENAVVSLLTASEYKKIGEANYLVGDAFWIIDDGNMAYVDEAGTVVDQVTNVIAGVRPTITIPTSTLYGAGTGTKANPYIIGGDPVIYIKDAYVGEYVNYGGYKWRIIETLEDKVKLVMNDSLEYDSFYSKNKEYNLSNGVGLYLNSTFYETLANNDYIVSSNYYIDAYKDSYENVYNKVVEANIGMLTLGDFYLNDIENVYTMASYGYGNNTAYVINAKKKLYVDSVSNKHNVRPVIYIDGNLGVTSGNGSLENAYGVSK